MGRLIIVEPMPIALISADRGTGVENLLTPDPKEVWADTAVGSLAAIYIDLGQVRTIDTILLGYVTPPTVEAAWSIGFGLQSYGETVVPFTYLRAPDVAQQRPATSHAIWHGEPQAARYVQLRVFQPAGSPPLTAGVLVIGEAFIAELGQEWGSGRRPIDLGSATPLNSGGFSVVEGGRKSAFSWTFGDLSIEEADQLDAIADHRGSTQPVLVVEDPDPTPGLVRRIHYGLFTRWRAFERRNRRQTRWELEIEQWT